MVNCTFNATPTERLQLYSYNQVFKVTWEGDVSIPKIWSRSGLETQLCIQHKNAKNKPSSKQLKHVANDCPAWLQTRLAHAALTSCLLSSGEVPTSCHTRSWTSAGKRRRIKRWSRARAARPSIASHPARTESRVVAWRSVRFQPNVVPAESFQDRPRRWDHCVSTNDWPSPAVVKRIVRWAYQQMNRIVRWAYHEMNRIVRWSYRETNSIVI